MAGFELTVSTAVQGFHIYKYSWAPTVGKNSSATKKRPMNTTGTLWLCTELEIQTTFLGTFQKNFRGFPFSITGRVTHRR